MSHITGEQPDSPNGVPLDGQWWLGFALKWWILITVGTGTFMGGMSTNVVNTVLPVLRQSFNTDLATIEWVVMAYLLTVSVLLLSFGRLGDIIGHRRIYLGGFVTFTLASFLCSLASSEGFLILFRILQGAGAAMLAASAPAILTKSFSASQRGQVLGIQAMMTYFGLMLGPSIGGFLTEQFGWQSVFYISIPFGILGIALVLLVIPSYTSGQEREPFDLAGAGTLMVGLGALMLAVNKGQDLSWTSPFVLALLALAAVFITLFLWLENRVHHPMLDLSLFRDRLFATATFSAFINYLCAYSVTFLLPFYLIQGRGFSLALVGLLLTTEPLIMAIVSPVSGYFSDRIGSRPLSTLGMLLLTVGLFTLRDLGAQTSEMDIVLRLFLIGLGIGIFGSPNNSAIMGSAPPHRQGIAAGMLAIARNLGMVFGVAVSGAVFSLNLASHTAAQVDPKLAFYGAIDDAFIVVAIIAILGVISSMARGSARGNTGEVG